MKETHKNILDAIEKFKVLDRNHLVKMFFEGKNNPVQSCNITMARLRKKGYVQANLDVRPYDYYLNPSSVALRGIKTLHYKAIADFYLEICKYDKPTVFEVEYKPAGKMVEMDAFMIWQDTPFYLEVQRSVQSHKVMSVKYDNYVKYYESYLWKKEYWQPKEKIFPHIWMYSDKEYNFPDEPIKILQTNSVRKFIYKYIR